MSVKLTPLSVDLEGLDVDLANLDLTDAEQAKVLVESDAGGIFKVNATASGAFDGLAGNGIVVDFEDTESGGLDVNYADGVITVDFGGANSTAENIAAAIDAIAGFDSSEEEAGAFTIADDIEVEGTLEGGKDIEYYIETGQSERILVMVENGAGDVDVTFKEGDYFRNGLGGFTKTVEANDTMLFGPFESARFQEQEGGGRLNFSFIVSSNVKVGALEI